MTGVPVIPTVGWMSPQGSDAAGTGVPRWFDHSTVPSFARQGVDRVVLGGHVHRVPQHEGLTEEGAIEHR